VAVAALGVVFSAAVVRAEDAPGIDVTGFVDGYYGYNFNSPTSKVNNLRTFDADHNSLTLAVAEIAFEKKPTEGSAAGFRVDLNFGPNADLVNAFEPSSFDSLKNLEQGYVSWLASPKVQLDFGKFVTPIGAEVIESKDNWNYTRSFQFGWAVMPRTICWLDEVASEISTLPPVVSVCAPFCHVSVSSRLYVGAPRQLGPFEVNQVVSFVGVLMA
jgi:hypothetical protein